jgi:hypothetical protein
MFDILTIFCGWNKLFCYGINDGRTPIRRIKLKNNDMNPKRLIPIILMIATVFTSPTTVRSQSVNPYPTIGTIPLPAGYTRVPAEKNSFAAWLRMLPLKKNRTVYLYNGSPKTNQEAQFAVLDVSVNDPAIQPGAAPAPAAPGIPRKPQDLQQCADAVMRLRAEFLYGLGDFARIDFYTGQGTRLNFAEWLQGRRYSISGGRLIAFSATATKLDITPNGLRKIFGEYLQTVFTYCGTLSLEKQLDPVSSQNHLSSQSYMEIGDILIHGGSPGHAMLVIDMASNQAGQKIYMLSQGYMPAQDIHIVRNLYNDALSPWYLLEDKTIYTPEYTFEPWQLRAWHRSTTPAIL